MPGFSFRMFMFLFQVGVLQILQVRLYDTMPGAVSTYVRPCTLIFKYRGGVGGARQMIPLSLLWIGPFYHEYLETQMKMGIYEFINSTNAFVQNKPHLSFHFILNYNTTVDASVAQCRNVRRTPDLSFSRVVIFQLMIDVLIKS